MAIANGITVLGRSVELDIFQGVTFEKEFAVLDDAGVAINLTSGYTAKLQARINQADAAAVVDLANGSGLTLGNGKITMSLAADDAQALDFDSPARYWLVLTQTSGTVVTLIAAGVCRLHKSYIAP